MRGLQEIICLRNISIVNQKLSGKGHENPAAAENYCNSMLKPLTNTYNAGVQSYKTNVFLSITNKVLNSKVQTCYKSVCCMTSSSLFYCRAAAGNSMHALHIELLLDSQPILFCCVSDRLAAQQQTCSLCTRAPAAINSGALWGIERYVK